MTFRITEANSFNGWDPLKQIILGNPYSPDFFKDIPDLHIRNMMQTLMSETIEDLDKIQETLENLGVDVIRIPLNTLDTGDNLSDKYESFTEFIEKESHRQWQTLPKPMITPRDYAITLGNKIFPTTSGRQLEKIGLADPEVYDNRLADEREKLWKDKWCLGPFKYNDQPRNIDEKEWKDWCIKTWNFWAPVITRFGDTLVVDVEEVTNLAKWMLGNFPQYKQANVAIGGHNDGSYCPVKPGQIICAPWMKPEDFKDTLPGWDVLRIDNPGNPTNHFHDWYASKDTHKGKWWVEGSSDKFAGFVDKWLNEWVGYCEETVFEVNMLSTSPEQILSMSKHDVVHKKLESVGIEPIYCRFRHRHFWDGGLHCLTLDTVRDSKMENYFNG